MAKRKVDPVYLEWANELPENIREQTIETFLNSKAADRVFNLNAEFTKATQERAEAQRQVEASRRQLEGVAPFINWYNQNQDVLRDENFAEIAQGVRQRRGGTFQPQQQPQDDRAAIEGRLAKARQDYMEVSAMFTRGGIDWDEAQKGLATIARQMAEDTQALQQLTATYANDVQNVRQEQGQLRRQLEEQAATNAKLIAQHNQNNQMLGQEQVQFQLEAMEYLGKHRDRDVSRIIGEFKTGKYPTFTDAANAIYGEDDYQARVKQDAEAMMKEWQAKQPPANGEGPMSSYPQGPRQFRRGEPEPRSMPTRETAQDGQNGQPMTPGGIRRYRHSMTEAQVDEKIREVLANPEIQQSLQQM